MFLAAYNTEIAKYTLLVLAAPFWWPFLKALYAELNNALREEGGLVGRAPSAEQLRKINRDAGEYQSPLISEEHPVPGARRAAAPSRGVAGGTKPRGEIPARRSEAPAKAGFARPRTARGFSRKDQR
jgi:hypothetical protein